MRKLHVRTCDDHDGVGLGDDALEEDDVGVLELPHDARLREEVDLSLVGEIIYFILSTNFTLVYVCLMK